MTLFSFPFRNHKKLMSLFVLAMLLAWTSFALAVKPDPSAPGAHLLIKEVEVVVDAGIPQTTFTIAGQVLILRTFPTYRSRSGNLAR